MMIRNPLVGAIAGDMIGVPYEFLRHGVAIAPTFPLWMEDSHFSDDSVMTMAVAKWLIEDNKHETFTLIKCMQELGRKYRNCGYGSSFGQWLDSDNPQPYGSWGNGAAMRVSPIGVAFTREEDVSKYAELQASVSHNSKEGYEGARAIALAVRAALSNYNKDAIYSLIHERIPSYSIDRSVKFIMDSGYTFKVSCQESVPEALCCFFDSSSYEETIRKAILLRGDTDTQACMAGAIAGAFWGVPDDIVAEMMSRFPADLLNILEEFSVKFHLPL